MQYFIPMHSAWGPVIPPPPPPPPPPRTHKRQLSGTSQTSAAGIFDSTPADMTEQFDAASRDCHGNASCSQSCCRELRQVVVGLEQRMGADIARIQQDAQREQQRLSEEVTAKWKGMESTSWKHVGELKDQNRQMRQKNYELEVQNGHLSRHVMLLQEQMAAFKDQQAQFQSALRASQDRAALLSATLADSKMVKVPHTGADIW